MTWSDVIQEVAKAEAQGEGVSTLMDIYEAQMELLEVCNGTKEI